MMIAKFRIGQVIKLSEHAEELHLSAVTEKPFDADGNSEDNSFAKWTPCGEMKMTITNPALLGKFTSGQKFYLNFTPADS